MLCQHASAQHDSLVLQEASLPVCGPSCQVLQHARGELQGMGGMLHIVCCVGGMIQGVRGIAAAVAKLPAKAPFSGSVLG